MLKTAPDFSVSLFSDIPDRHYPEQFRLLRPHFLHIKMLFYKSMGYTLMNQFAVCMTVPMNCFIN